MMQRKTTPPQKGNHSPWFMFCIILNIICEEISLFYVDHMALLYLIKKPQILSRIMRWLLLFLEYDFLVVYKPRHSHLMVGLSHNFLMLPKIRGCLIELLTHNYLYFNHSGLQEVYMYIFIINFLKGYSMDQQLKLALKALPFTIINGKLYKQRQDQFLRQWLHDTRFW